MIRTAGTASRAALVILIVALSLGAALAITVVLTDAVGALGPRLLGTAGFAALAALTGLCASVLFGRRGLVWVAVVGIVASAGTFVVGMAYVWDVVQPSVPEDLLPLGAAVVASIAIGWSSLLLLLLGRSIAVTVATLTTIAAIAALAGLLIAVMVVDRPPGVILARATAVTAILAALGSFLAPLLDRVIRGPDDPNRTDGATRTTASSWAG